MLSVHVYLCVREAEDVLKKKNIRILIKELQYNNALKKNKFLNKKN